MLVIVLLMLQNASSPFGTVRWWLSVTVPSAQQKQMSILLADVCYIAAYALCRVWLLYWVVARFANMQPGRGVLEGFWSLKWHCQMGMLGMGFVNVRWLVKIVKRAAREALEAQRKEVKVEQRGKVEGKVS